ncbi:MAG: DUF4416 family protein [Acidobacteriota bacterium]
MQAARRKPAPEVLPFFAVAWAREGRCEAAEVRLTGLVGPLVLCSPVYCFSEFSSYYDAELGGRVWKYLVAADRLVRADELVTIKLATEEIEAEFRRTPEAGGGRTVNIDPGYVNGWQVVLATVKNHGHRLYLGRGIFGEVTLRYVRGRFEGLPWTYPDYLSEPVQHALEAFRRRYLELLGGASD